MNQGIRFKLLFSFAIVFFVFAGIQVYQFSIINNQVEHLHDLKDKTIKTSHLATELQLSVILVQEHLTDISATQAKGGYDDGFAEAEKSAEEFKSTLQELIQLNPEKASELKTFENVFESYYATGIEMANAFIQGGPEEGNQYMDDFDKSATDIYNKVDPLVEEALAGVDHSVESMEESTNALIMKSLIIFIAILIICIVIALYSSRQIVTPIFSLTGQFEKAAQGDLTAEVVIRSRDELGNLGNSFNKMLKDQREVMLKVLTASKTVASASSDLSTSIQQTSAGLEEITAAVVEISSGLQQNAASAQETNISTAKIAEVAREVKENTTLGKDKSIKVKQISETGLEKVKVSVQAMESIEISTSHLCEAMGAFSELSNRIGSITNTIDAIANQTNLLALNAAIEAARAGEQGRGFAVVAEEVRKLAEESSQSVREITSIINSIQTQTQDMVNKMQESFTQVLQGKEISQDVYEYFIEIVNSIGELNGVIDNIASATEFQSTSIQQVSVAVDEMAKVTSHAAESSENISSSSEEQNAIMEQLTETSSRLNGLSAELEKLVNIFIV